MANTRIGRTVSVAGSRRKATFSAWVKRTGLGESWIAKFGGNYSQNNYMQIGFNSDNGCFIVGDTPSSTPRMESTRKFRDTNSWYHYVVAFDTEQSTASNRLKFYINGEQVTSFVTATYPTLNQDLNFNMTGSYNNAWLGGRGESTYEFNGLMSHVHWCDGYVYDASAFGSTDATTGEWKINTSPSVTYGTNGYFMLKDGNSLTDASGNGNNFSSLVGTLTKTEDSPSNVFATINNLVPSDIASLSNGNTTLRQSDQASAIATLGFQGGKYYWEVKNSNQQSYTQIVGVLRQARMEASGNDGYNVGTNDGSWGYFMQSNQDNGKSFHNNTLGSVYQTTSANDILQVAVDSDAGKIWWGVNGTWVNSGDPANGTNAVYTNLPTDDVLFPAFSNYNAGQFQINFGNGYFGTTAVSSAGTNASGIGIFEYDIPTGYTALSTKGLNL
jgi:hypothetical protein